MSGSGIDSELAVYLHQGMSHILQDAGYEIVHFEELEKKIRRHVSGDILSCDQRISYAAARALKAYDGVGALDICVTSVTSLGLGELNNEGRYEERLRMRVGTKLLEAEWGQRGVPGPGDAELPVRPQAGGAALYRAGLGYEPP